MLELKKYQEDTIESVEEFCKALFNYSQQGQAMADMRAWKKIGQDSEYQSRVNPLYKNTPNVCLKIPTGGGKTLIGIKSIHTIKQEYLRNNTGLVVWIVPTKAIYQQTLKGLKDYDHPYRQELDRIAPNKRVKIKEKKDRIHLAEVKNDLVILVLMLQSANRKDPEFLKMYQEDSKYQEFFPGTDEILKARELIEKMENLDIEKASEYKISIKCSLGNVLKICQPLVIIDEAHKADSEIALDTINNMNPSFLLELTATPKRNSNILVDIPGNELKKESMIKLPINLVTQNHTDWKNTIHDSIKKLKELSEYAKRHAEETGEYIRPINLIRVERTGKKQEGTNYIHAEKVKKHIIENMGYSEEEVRIKSSEKDELGNENLLSPESRVKIIITKDALKEGWDCSFAYILTILDNTTSSRGLTQMLGRVLRQPYTNQSNIKQLNEAYVFCLNPNVGDMVEAIEKGLTNEGLEDAKYMINRISDDNRVLTNLVQRREKYRGIDYLIPKVLINDNGQLRELGYERDILSSVPWSELKPPLENLDLEGKTERRVDQIDIGGENKVEQEEVWVQGSFSAQDIAMNLIDIIPNAWQAMRIGREFMEQVKHKDAEAIYKNKAHYMSAIREKIKNDVDTITKRKFTEKFQAGEIKFSFDAHETDWKIPEEYNKTILEHDVLLTDMNGNEVQHSLFPEIGRHYNKLEKAVAGYIDTVKGESIECWHRVARGQEFGIQGWRKYKIYPDFVILRDKGHYIYLETKGRHLEKAKDTEHKKLLFNMLNSGGVKNLEDIGDIVGESTIMCKDEIKKMPLVLVMLHQEKWQQNIDKVL